MNSILLSIKNLLGIQPQDDGFDRQIISYINSSFFTLNQIGVGPEQGFSISGPEQIWDDFSTNYMLDNAAQQFVFLDVKLLFDPPVSSYVLDSYKKKQEELTWRLNLYAEGQDGLY